MRQNEELIKGYKKLGIDNVKFDENFNPFDFGWQFQGFFESDASSFYSSGFFEKKKDGMHA